MNLSLLEHNDETSSISCIFLTISFSKVIRTRIEKLILQYDSIYTISNKLINIILDIVL